MSSLLRLSSIRVVSKKKIFSLYSEFNSSINKKDTTLYLQENCILAFRVGLKTMVYNNLDRRRKDPLSRSSRSTMKFIILVSSLVTISSTSHMFVHAYLSSPIIPYSSFPVKKGFMNRNSYPRHQQMHLIQSPRNIQAEYPHEKQKRNMLPRKRSSIASALFSKPSKSIWNKLFRRKKEKIQWEWEPRPLEIDSTKDSDDNSTSGGNTGNQTTLNSKSTSRGEKNKSEEYASNSTLNEKNVTNISNSDMNISITTSTPSKSKSKQVASKKKDSNPLQKFKKFFKFVTLAVMVTVLAPFMRLSEDEYGDVVGVSFKAPNQISGINLNPYQTQSQNREESKGEKTDDEANTKEDEGRKDSEVKSKIDGEESLPKNVIPISPPPPDSSFQNDYSNNRVSSSKPQSSYSRINAIGSVQDAVAKAGPATIRIDTETDIERASHQIEDRYRSKGGSGSGDTNDDSDDDDEALDGIPDRMKFIQQGQGSGVIFCKEGLVLTNAHVVQDASRVTVTLTDGRRFRAEVKGTDDIVDIAVLKIIFENDNGKKPLPVAEFGDSDELQVGQFVVAVGSPGGK